MTLPEAIGQYLRTEATNTIAAVGTKSFWCYETQNVTAPWVTFKLASSRRISEHLTGAGAPRISTVEVLCVAANQAAAWVVAEAVKVDTDNLTGIIPTGGAVKIKRCVVTDEADAVSDATLSSGLAAVSLTLTITT